MGWKGPSRFIPNDITHTNLAMMTLNPPRSLVCFAAICLMLNAPTRVEAAAFNVTDLGSIVGGDRILYGGYGINESGHFTGSVDLDGVYGGDGHAYRYNGTFTDIGTLGGAFSIGMDINETGTVVGWSANSPGQLEHALLYDGTLTDLGTLPGGDYSLAKAINDNGVVVGGSSVSPGAGIIHAFLYENGVMNDLGTNGGMWSIAEDINSHNDVVGTVLYSFVGGGVGRPFLYDGAMHDLGLPPGAIRAVAVGINDGGWVTGAFVEPARDGSQINTASTLFLYDGSMHILGSLDAHRARTDALVNAINNRGYLVGQSYDNGEGGPPNGRAYIYTPHTGMLDLNTLIEPSSGWQIVNALDINDAGQIVAEAKLNGAPRSVMLTPDLDLSPIGDLPDLPVLPITVPGSSLFGLTGRTMSLAQYSGDNLQTGEYTSPTNIVVGGGVELADFGNGNAFTIDLATRLVTITAEEMYVGADVDVLRLADATGILPTINSVLIDPQTNWPGFTSARLANDGDAVSINLSGLSASAGQKIVLDLRLEFRFVPEPHAALLGLVGVTMFHRRLRICRP